MARFGPQARLLTAWEKRLITKTVFTIGAGKTIFQSTALQLLTVLLVIFFTSTPITSQASSVILPKTLEVSTILH